MLSSALCVNPFTVDARKSEKLVQALSTHNWKLEHHESKDRLGVIVRLRCSSCLIEWTSVIVEPSDINATGLSKGSSDLPEFDY